MAKHLKPAHIAAIVDVIGGWRRDKLTWEAIIVEAAQVLGFSPSRQTLNAHPAIKVAYAAKKKGLVVPSPRTSMPSSLAVAAQRIARQQAENDRLTNINNRLLEQFAKWQYNAYKLGVKEHQLNEDLPRINRERTED